MFEEATGAVTEAVGETVGVTVKELMFKGRLGLLAERGDISGELWLASIVLCVILAYLMGSLNFAVIISRLKFKGDIRAYGSKNAGATNMSRVYGKKAGAVTLVCDILKTVLPVFVTSYLCGEVIGYLAGFFCALGHAFPCYYRFKGGKCVAVFAALAVTLDPLVFLFSFLIFVVVVLGTKYVSLASITSALMYPMILYNILVSRNGISDLRVVFALMTSILVVIRHKDNIKRLLDGQENKFYLKKKTK